MNKRHISIEELENLADSKSLNDISYRDLVNQILESENIAESKPELYYSIDPRDETKIIYSEARASRPQDNIPEDVAKKHPDHLPCPICTGKTTSIFDIYPLSDGATFFNKNLYPILYYHNNKNMDKHSDDISKIAYGGHYLQWISSDHYVDINNINKNDLFIVMKRLAEFEKFLLHADDSEMDISDNTTNDGYKHKGWSGIVKNEGHLVGGSLTHGHIQIIHTNILPRKIELDMRFLDKNGISFAKYILENNPSEYIIKEYPGNIMMLVPYYMRRPLDVLIIPQDTSKDYLHDLSDDEILGIGMAFQDSTAAIKDIMPKMGIEYTYNMIFHNGPIGGLYLELMPYTQQIGGYEHMGLYVCQGTPKSTHNMYMDWFRENR